MKKRSLFTLSNMQCNPIEEWKEIVIEPKKIEVEGYYIEEVEDDKFKISRLK